MRTIRCFLLATVAIVMLSACSCPITKVRQAAARTQRINTIKMIGIAYHNFCDSNPGKAPAAAADLQKFTAGDPAANAALTDGSFTFIYGVTLADMQQKGLSLTVIGYDTQFDKGNVIVLMGDSLAQYVSSAEFEKMPKAAPAANK